MEINDVNKINVNKIKCKQKKNVNKKNQAENSRQNGYKYFKRNWNDEKAEQHVYHNCEVSSPCSDDSIQPTYRSSSRRNNVSLIL